MSRRTSHLWIGTSTNLLQIDKGTTRAHTVFPPDILPKGAIKDLTLDSEDNLWFSIGGRIFCYMTGPRIIKEINSAVFGKHTILSASRAIVNHREQIVFGSTDHLIVIDPRLALNQPDKTQILLTDLQIDHQKTKIDSLIRLSYQSKWVTLFSPRQAPISITTNTNTASAGSWTNGKAWTSPIPYPSHNSVRATTYSRSGSTTDLPTSPSVGP